MNTEENAQIRLLRASLHAAAEGSGHETHTRELLWSFLASHTSLTLHPCGHGFYAAHREENTALPAIALRADYDALLQKDGTASHTCGHDGHAAALCGVALALEGKTLGRNVFLLFQPEEETGEGAKGCLELFRMEQVGEIYGAHNLPGVPLGQVLTRPGTFACASRGVILHMTGKATHAAYPEHGISPSSAVGELLCKLPVLSARSRFCGMTLCTVVGVKMGERAFGIAAYDAELCLTLRAEHDADLNRLEQDILSTARSLCAKYKLTFSDEEQDVFIATENDPDCACKVLSLCGGKRLSVPMRWSEDFGQYLHHCKGAYFGIGAGVDHPALHTAGYEYPDALLEPTVDAFLRLLEG